MFVLCMRMSIGMTVTIPSSWWDGTAPALFLYSGISSYLQPNYFCCRQEFNPLVGLPASSLPSLLFIVTKTNLLFFQNELIFFLVLVSLKDNVQHSCEQFQTGRSLRLFYSSFCMKTVVNVNASSCWYVLFQNQTDTFPKWSGCKVFQ